MKSSVNSWVAIATTSAALSVAMVLATAHSAQAIEFNFSWQGDAGYSAVGIFSYDQTTAPPIISESGSGPTNFLDSLMVSFFDPSNNLLQSFNTVANGVSESPFFAFNFGTSTQSLFGPFNVGGGIGVIGELFFFGEIGSSLELRQDVDQMGASILLDSNSGAITVTQVPVTQVPEPASVLGLLAFSAMGASFIRQKKQV